MKLKIIVTIMKDCQMMTYIVKGLAKYVYKMVKTLDPH
ncbi:MAG: hypothetical protein SRB1_01490 [Desulfobacteraceae bacterium Eth-SRB1]|nr:MAG: hypothetical protein SRB1_01490 [Desulfobacteraceae bacterium Eth-SRB1]